jgi:hypothetical protein
LTEAGFQRVFEGHHGSKNQERFRDFVVGLSRSGSNENVKGLKFFMEDALPYVSELLKSSIEDLGKKGDNSPIREGLNAEEIVLVVRWLDSLELLVEANTELIDISIKALR